MIKVELGNKIMENARNLGTKNGEIYLKNVVLEEVYNILSDLHHDNGNEKMEEKYENKSANCYFSYKELENGLV